MIVHSAARRAVRAGADQEARDLLDRLLRRREADAQQPVAAERRQPLEREREVRAALVRRERVDLVDDHGARGREHRAAGLRAEQDVERLRRGDEDVRRRAAHALALARRRVAGAHPGADLDVRQALRAQAPRGCRRAALRGCAGCRSRAPSAARRRRPASRPRARRRGPGAPARRSPRGRRRASCPTRSAPRSACAGRPGSPATPAPAPRVGAAKLRSNQAATAG